MTVTEAPPVTRPTTSDALGAALAALAEIDLRTIKDKEARATLKDVRTTLQGLRKALK